MFKNIINTIIKHKKIVVGILSFVIVATSLALFVFDTSDENSNEEKIYIVETITAMPENSEDILEYAAVVKNQDTENVMFSTVATIDNIYVKEGEFVQEGQLLVSVDDENAQTQIDTAERNMNNAKAVMDDAEEALELSKKQYDRIVVEQNNDTEYLRLKNDYDNALIARNSAQAELDEANANIKVEEDKLADYESDLQEKTQNEIAAQEKVNELQAQVAANPADVGLQAELATANSELILATNAKNDAQSLVTTQEGVVAAKIVSENRAGKEAALISANAAYESARIPYETKVADMEMELAVAESEVRTDQIAYDNAVNAYEASVTAHENALEAREDMNYYAKNDGTVLTILSKEGEVATPLEPVLVIGTVNMIAEFGVSSSDIEKLEVSNKAMITLGDETFSGEVVSVDLLPDETSRTYTTDVLINTDGKDFQIGELVSVEIFVGESMEVLLPINSILNDGLDYVFVVEDERAVRRDVTLGNIVNNEVKVYGLNPNDEVIIKGMKSVKSGYKVSVNSNG